MSTPFRSPPAVAKQNLWRLIARAQQGVYILAKHGLNDHLLQGITALIMKMSHVNFQIIFPQTDAHLPPAWRQLAGSSHCHLLMAEGELDRFLVLADRVNGFMESQRSEEEIAGAIFLFDAKIGTELFTAFSGYKRRARALNGGH